MSAKSARKTKGVRSAHRTLRGASRPTVRNGPRTRTATMTSTPGERLQDRGEIARGGMGVIRKVFDTRLERHAALKVIDQGLATHPEALGRFLDEARITGQLDHPNIVPVYDATVDAAGTPTALLMKLVEGETLAQRIGMPGTVRTQRDLRTLLEIFLKVCDAIAFAHSRGVIHRDLKPDNVMLGAFGQVYVMDWGCAHIKPGAGRREGAPRRTFYEEQGTVIGTPGYMAPEQARGATEKIDERTDVFGLGGILYQILTGDPPYPHESATGAVAAARRGQPKMPQSVAGIPNAPPIGLRRIVMRALAENREDRFSSVEELKNEVESFLRGGSYFTTKTFSPGTLILREGEPADEAYVVTQGRCEAFRKRGGRRIALRTIGPGDVFGEAAIFAAGAKRNASVVAVDKVTAVVVSREILHEELALDSWMGAFVRALALRYRDFESRRQLAERVAESSRVIAMIVGHISRAGTWVSSGVLGTQWSRTWATIGSELRLSESAVLDIIARSGDLSLDRKSDMILLEVTTLE